VSYDGTEVANNGVTLDGARAEAEAVLRERNKGGATVAEADFVAGAVTVMDYVFGNPEESTILPGWYIRALMGRPVLDG
jgi:hypothetical protein